MAPTAASSNVYSMVLDTLAEWEATVRPPPEVDEPEDEGVTADEPPEDELLGIFPGVPLS